MVSHMTSFEFWYEQLSPTGQLSRAYARNLYDGGMTWQQAGRVWADDGAAPIEPSKEHETKPQGRPRTIWTVALIEREMADQMAKVCNRLLHRRLAGPATRQWLVEQKDRFEIAAGLRNDQTRAP